MLEQGLEPMDFDSFRREAMSDQASIDPKIRIEEVVMEFIKQRGRKPNSLDELKEFYEMSMGTAKNPGMDVVKELVEDDKTRITLAGGSFPDLSDVADMTSLYLSEHHRKLSTLGCHPGMPPLFRSWHALIQLPARSLKSQYYLRFLILHLP